MAQRTVDNILDNWFGGPPEHRDDEALLLKYLYEPLRAIEAERDQLRRRVTELGWQVNPERMGQ